MSATTVELSLPEEQLTLLEDVQHLLKQYLDQQNNAVWLTEEEAAQRLRVARSTIRKWKKAGWLRYAAEGKNISYRADYLDADFEARAMVVAPLSRLNALNLAKPPRRLAS